MTKEEKNVKKRGKKSAERKFPRRKKSVVIPPPQIYYPSADKNTCALCTCFPVYEPYYEPKVKKLNQCQKSPETLYELAERAADATELPSALDWTVEEVADWMENDVGFPNYRDCILVNKIDGKRLVLLEDPSVMPMINIHYFDDIKKITAAIRQLYGLDDIKFSRSIGLPPRRPPVHIKIFKSRTGPSWGIRKNWTKSLQKRTANDAEDIEEENLQKRYENYMISRENKMDQKYKTSLKFDEPDDFDKPSFKKTKARFHDNDEPDYGNKGYSNRRQTKFNKPDNKTHKLTQKRRQTTFYNPTYANKTSYDDDNDGDDEDDDDFQEYEQNCEVGEFGELEDECNDENDFYKPNNEESDFYKPDGSNESYNPENEKNEFYKPGAQEINESYKPGNDEGNEFYDPNNDGEEQDEKNEPHNEENEVYETKNKRVGEEGKPEADFYKPDSEFCGQDDELRDLESNVDDGSEKKDCQMEENQNAKERLLCQCKTQAEWDRINAEIEERRRNWRNEVSEEIERLTQVHEEYLRNKEEEDNCVEDGEDMDEIGDMPESGSDILRWMKILNPRPVYRDHWDLVWYQKPDIPCMKFGRVPKHCTLEPVPRYKALRKEICPEYLAPRKFRVQKGIPEEHQVIWMEHRPGSPVPKETDLQKERMKKKKEHKRTIPKKSRLDPPKVDLTGLSGRELLLARRLMPKKKFMDFPNQPAP